MDIEALARKARRLIDESECDAPDRVWFASEETAKRFASTFDLDWELVRRALEPAEYGGVALRRAS